MKTISLTEFKKMTTSDIRKSPSLEITSDGEHVAFLVVGTQEGMRDKIRAIASQADAGRGV